MICVSIGRGRHRHMIAEHRHLVEQGAQLVELRLDYIHGEVNVRRLLNNRPCAVIATCRRERDGGKYAGSEDSRLMLLRAAIAEGVEYVDLEEDVAAQVPRFGATQRIISYHDFRKTSDDLAGIEARLRALDADIVKVATMANHPLDNLRMLQLIRASAGPTVGMCMGDIGSPSRILAGRFGSPITYATFHHERALAPGQLSYEQMTEIYHYDDINEKTDVYGIVGDPISPSVEPMIFNAALHDSGLNAVHVPFRVPRESLGEFVDQAPAFGIRGLSIAVPHNETIAAKLTKVDTAAKGIQSVNTIVLRGADVIGFNTTCRAVLDCLDRVLEEENGKSASLSGRLALVLGAGDVAKAVVYGLRSRGARIIIASRRRAQTDALAKKYRGRAIEWHARHTIAANLLVNCTPVGMHPSLDETPFDKHHLKPSMLVLDAVYNPEQTLLVKEARKQSCRVITGVELFVRQVCLQFRLFSGKEPPAELMRQVLKRAIGPVKY